MLEINFPDKILAGVHQSYTLLCDEGMPEGQVLVGSDEAAHRVIPLGPPKDEPTGTPLLRYKVTFYIPEDAVGKSLGMKFRAGSSEIDESKEITAE